MNNMGLALLIGLLAGIAGGFIPQLVSSGGAAGGGEAAALADDGGMDVNARLARIEAALDRITGGPMEAGGDPALKGNAPIRVSLDAESMAELKEATRATVKETLAEMQPAEGAAAGTLQRGPMRFARKRTKLADAAAELGLSSGEEDEVRRIYAETMEKAFKLLAGEDGDVDQVRRDIESVQQDPSKRFSVFGKYMPRVLPKIGEFMQLDADRRKRVEQVVGKDKARDLERKYDIEESNPLGIGGNMRFEAEMDGPVVGR